MSTENNKPKLEKIAIDKKQAQVLRILHSKEGRIAESLTRFSGSMPFVYLHAAWFLLWISINQGILKTVIPIFDPFPYGLLTMVVSLEAIFLSTFIMVAQNRQALLDKFRDLEDDKEQHEEDLQDEELEKDVEDLAEDVQDIQQDVDTIQKDLDDILKAVSVIQQKLVHVDKTKNNMNNHGNDSGNDDTK
jgi:uncharacterized membrane protein